MKTEKVIENLKCCNGGSCAECTMDMKPGCTDELMFAAEKKLQAVHEDVGRCKKKIADLKKVLEERKAAPGWISVEERLPEESGYYLAYDCRGNLFICLYQANGLWDSSSVDYWMPLPEPPKKVKTYEDVYRERIKEAFPELDVNHVKPAYCRAQVFSEEVDCDGIYGDCKACWNQAYPEEEGGERNEGEDRTVLQVLSK